MLITEKHLIKTLLILYETFSWFLVLIFLFLVKEKGFPVLHVAAVKVVSNSYAATSTT